MKLQSILFLLVCIIFTSCGPSADEILADAETLINNEDFYEAKEKINIVLLNVQVY